MPPQYPVQMIEIRPGSAADAPAIALVRRESWFAAYDGIIAMPVIDRATATGGRVTVPPSYRRTLVVVGAEHPAVIAPPTAAPTSSPAWAPSSRSATPATSFEHDREDLFLDVRNLRYTC
jgi:hypothetical protein